MKLRLSFMYYLWTAYFCLIKTTHLSRGAKTLDFGCGVGNLVEALRYYGIQSYGIDPSPAAEKFSRALPYLLYKSLWQCNFTDNSFDLIYSNEVLEHIVKKELKLYLEELYRISKGTMIHVICTKERGGVIYSDSTHVTLETEEWWKNHFEAQGFHVKVGNPFYFFPNIIAPQLNLNAVQKGFFVLRKKKLY